MVSSDKFSANVSEEQGTLTAIEDGTYTLVKCADNQASSATVEKATENSIIITLTGTLTNEYCYLATGTLGSFERVEGTPIYKISGTFTGD